MNCFVLFQNSLKTYSGVSGDLKFDGKGGVIKEKTKLLRIEGNKTVEI